MAIAGITLMAASSIALGWQRFLGRPYTMGELSGTRDRWTIGGLLLLAAGLVFSILGATR